VPGEIKVKNKFVTFFLIAGIGIFARVIAQTMPDTNNAEAKQHYANAEANIAKGDWTSARSELIKLKALTPNNALVLYDLGLAYSHTGDKSLALTELQSALKIGLPTSQSENAEKLIAQLQMKSETGVVWLQCDEQGTITKYGPFDRNGDREKLETPYTYSYFFKFKSATGQLWSYNTATQGLELQNNNPGFGVDDEWITVFFYPSRLGAGPQKLMRIVRKTLEFLEADFYEGNGAGVGHDGNGYCKKIPPRPVNAHPGV
jgi:hypothetical protein